MVPGLNDRFISIDSLIARLRRTKSNDEIELLYKACNITMIAQEAAAQVNTVPARQHCPSPHG